MHLKLFTHLIALSIVAAHFKGDRSAPTSAAESLASHNASSGDETRQGIFGWIGSILKPPSTTTSTAPPTTGRECSKCQCGAINTYRRIVGGEETQVNEYPWMAMLLRYGSFYCGASLINDLYVVTAAHCLRNINPRQITVRLLLHDQDDTEGAIDRHAAWAGWHEKYNGRTLDNDIGLIRFDKPIEWSDKLRAVCMPERDNRFVGYNATVTGWGALKEGGYTSDTLQELVVPVLSQSACRNTSYDAEDITENMLCAGYLEGGKDSCQGDSGGPLVLTDGDEGFYQLAGIVSWGSGCARPNAPGVYTRVNNYLDWIAQRTRDGCRCATSDDDDNGSSQTGGIISSESDGPVDPGSEAGGPGGPINGGQGEISSSDPHGNETELNG